MPVAGSFVGMTDAFQGMTVEVRVTSQAGAAADHPSTPAQDHPAWNETLAPNVVVIRFAVFRAFWGGRTPKVRYQTVHDTARAAGGRRNVG